MALFDAEAIIDRVRLILLTGAGSQRTIASGYFRGTLHPTMDASEQSVLATEKPIVDVVLAEQAIHDLSPIGLTSFQLWRFALVVTVVRGADLRHRLDGDDRAALYGALAQDADRVQQALCWPGNVNAGGLLSSTLMFDGSDPATFDFSSESATASIDLRFSGVAKVATTIP